MKSNLQIMSIDNEKKFQVNGTGQIFNKIIEEYESTLTQIQKENSKIDSTRGENHHSTLYLSTKYR